MKEIFSERVAAGSRTYFFDVKESEEGIRRLVISESRHTGSTWEHHRVMVFEEHLEKFSEIFDQAVWVMARRDQSGASPEKVPESLSGSQPSQQLAEVPKEFAGTSKAYHPDEVRQKHPRAYEKWTSDEDERLRGQYQTGLDILGLAAMLQRQPSAIRSRLIKLGLTPQD